VKWCKEHLQDAWDNTIATDEKCFIQDGGDTPKLFHLASHGRPTKAKLVNKQKNVHAVMSISASGFNTIQVLDGRLRGTDYAAFLHCAVPRGYCLLQDNCRSHRTAPCLKVCEQGEIQDLYMPPYSPDLNPIENVWSKLSKAMYFEGRTYATRQELIDSLFVEFEKMNQTPEYFFNLFRSMPQRMQKVIRLKGEKCGY
jgi:hypothetical protein